MIIIIISEAINYLLKVKEKVMFHRTQKDVFRGLFLSDRPSKNHKDIEILFTTMQKKTKIKSSVTLEKLEPENIWHHHQ